MTIPDHELPAIKAAPPFDVHRWSEHPEVHAAIQALYTEIITYRKAQNPEARDVDRDKVIRQLKKLVLDLYLAYQSSNSWRGLSLRKPDYQGESRYAKLHLSYDVIRRLLEDMQSMGFVEVYKGFLDRQTGIGRRTRVRATPKLMAFIAQPEFQVDQVINRVGIAGLVTDDPASKRPLIILRNEGGEDIPFDESEEIQVMRKNVEAINARLLKAHIALDVTDGQFEEIRKRLAPDAEVQRDHIDFTRKTLCRIFNTNFRYGGRFYGGWWIGLPSEYRKYIEIDHKPTVEVDYSAHHIRMLYARHGVMSPNDPYDIPDCPFTRQDLKVAFLVAINARDERSAVMALRDKGIEDPKQLLGTLGKNHPEIHGYFYSGFGLSLQYEDSLLAEKIMLRMMERGAVVLPVHDSFIVRNSYEAELKQVMDEVFSEIYNTPPAMKTKKTMLEEKDEGKETEFDESFVTDDLDELFQKLIEEKEIKRKIWGSK